MEASQISAPPNTIGAVRQTEDAFEVCAVCLLKVYADGGSTKHDKMYATYSQLHFPLMAFTNTQKDIARMGVCIHIWN
jgi:hypothetical protein